MRSGPCWRAVASDVPKERAAASAAIVRLERERQRQRRADGGGAGRDAGRGGQEGPSAEAAHEVRAPVPITRTMSWVASA